MHAVIVANKLIFTSCCFIIVWRQMLAKYELFCIVVQLRHLTYPFTMDHYANKCVDIILLMLYICDIWPSCYNPLKDANICRLQQLLWLITHVVSKDFMLQQLFMYLITFLMKLAALPAFGRQLFYLWMEFHETFLKPSLVCP